MFKRIVFFTLIVLIYACSSSTVTDSETPLDTFDRGVMLKNLADNIIIPAFENFNSEMDALVASGENFTKTPNQDNLTSLRTSWLAAYKTWQHIEMFNIGKAEAIQYSFFMNIYPLTIADVESNIANGNYDLNNSNNHDAQGFPALDYLLYGLAESDVEILEKYTSVSNAVNYKKYISDVLNQMSSLTVEVLNDWRSSYRDQFIASTDNTATSALNKMTNDYIYYFEKGLRANKFGIPAGVFSTEPLPKKVEAFYNQDISKELSLEALNTSIDFFNGKHYSSGTIGVGFSDYLESLENSILSQRIINQFNLAKSKINTLSNNFHDQVINDNTAMLSSYDELQKVVVLLKVDMLQAFDISTDYVDADGD